MPRKTDEERKAVLQRQIEAKKMQLKRIEKREADTARRARNHRLIVSGAIVEELLPKFRDTAFASAFIAAVREYIAAHPDVGAAFTELLDRLTIPDQREAAE